jgi:hypothetical protein
MNLDVAGVLADAWRMWKRDRDLLLGVGGFFLFLPQFATLLLVRDAPDTPQPGATKEAARLWTEAATQWVANYGLIVLICGLCGLFGTLLLYVLYLRDGQLDLKAALPAALRLLPRYLLVSILVSLPIALVHFPAIWPFLFFPMFYAIGRMLLAGAVMVAEPPLGALASIKRSIQLSRGHGFFFAGAAIVLLFGGFIIAEPFILLGRTLDGAPIANPVSAALLNGAAAAAAAFGSLAATLIQIALYRRLSASKGI